MDLSNFEKLTEFLGTVFDCNCEFVVQNCKKGCITAISNGYISGRHIGSPLTDLAKQIINNEQWKKCDYLHGYEGYALNGKLLNSATYFIKNDNELLGMFCINIDTSKYIELSEQILGMVNLMSTGISIKKDNSKDIRETFTDNLTLTFRSALKNIFGSNVPDKFTSEQRSEIINELDKSGAFLIKGNVHLLSKMLNCSESSIYRYLSNLKRSKISKY